MSGIDNFLNKQNQSNYYINTLPTPQTQTTATTITPQPAETINTSAVRDEFVKVKKENGIIRKFYNFLKNASGLGLGSKKVEKDIDKFEKGQISKEEINTQIQKYKASQKNGTQTVGDVAAAATSISSFMVADKFLKKYNTQDKLNALPSGLSKIINNLEESNNKWAKRSIKVHDLLKSKTKATIFMLPLLAIIGGSTKQTITNIDTLGSKEYSINKKDYADKKDYKAAKKAANKAKRKESWKNFGTGALNGILAPITTLVGGIVGVPAYIATTMGLKYATNKDNKEKAPFGDFTQKFKDNAIVNTLGVLLVAIPAFKKAHFNKVLGENLDKVANKLQGKTLKLPDLPSTKTAYQELEDVMVESEPIQKILKEFGSSLDEKIISLTNENIFAVKFLQIKNGGRYSEISEALRENCPPTRTLEQAQAHINKMWGTAEYQISKLLGVGTVAETYLAKDKSGKEVCIKVLKEGITADKIATDKEKFLKLIIGDTPNEKLTEGQKYLIRNVNDLAEGISKEVDFRNEMQAAEALRKHCKVTDVAKAIDVKDGIYIMEKAPGISVKTLVDYFKCESRIKLMKKWSQEDPRCKTWADEEIAKSEELIKKIKSRAPEFDDFEMTPSQIKRLLKNYIDLQVEQFSKIDKNGKVIHADIHPGNIFINLNSLKNGKGKLFTLIDTGNTINLSKEQAKTALRLTSLIKRGNVKDLTTSILDGAILPNGLTKETAQQKIETDLKKYFFDNETKIDSMNIDSFYTLTDNILRKYNIIPNNTQLNLNKAKTSAANSFEDLMQSFFSKKYGDLDESKMSKTELGKTIAQGIADMAEITSKLGISKTTQETKNLFQMSWKEALNFLKNPNNLKTNSEDYLTYEMKQNMPLSNPQKDFEHIANL